MSQFAAQPEPALMPDELLYGVDGAIATITLNAPQRMNTISGPMLKQLTQALVRANEDPAVRVALLEAGEQGQAGSECDLTGIAAAVIITTVAAAGADTFVAGSAIFNAPNYQEVIDKMRSELALARFGCHLRALSLGRVQKFFTAPKLIAADLPDPTRALHFHRGTGGLRPFPIRAAAC